MAKCGMEKAYSPPTTQGQSALLLEWLWDNAGVGLCIDSMNDY